MDESTAESRGESTSHDTETLCVSTLGSEVPAVQESVGSSSIESERAIENISKELATKDTLDEFTTDNRDESTSHDTETVCVSTLESEMPAV